MAEKGKGRKGKARSLNFSPFVRPEGRLLPGTALSEISRKHGLTNGDVEAVEEAIESARDRRPAGPMRFE
jgi:antitoxin FitA